MVLQNYSGIANRENVYGINIGGCPVFRARFCDTKMILLFLARAAKRTNIRSV